MGTSLLQAVVAVVGVACGHHAPPGHALATASGRMACFIVAGVLGITSP
jgi:hypothetical protein